MPYVMHSPSLGLQTNIRKRCVLCATQQPGYADRAPQREPRQVLVPRGRNQAQYQQPPAAPQRQQYEQAPRRQKAEAYAPRPSDSGPRSNAPEPDMRPLRRELESTARWVALQQLLRIEEEGAFVGLVSGAPPPGGMQASSRSRAASNGAAGASDAGRGASRLTGSADEGGVDVEVDVEEEVDELRPVRQAGKPLDPRDARLVKELVSGVTRMRRRLDYTVAKLTGRNAADLDPSLRQVLRMSIYELTERHLAPHAITAHVDLAKAAGGLAGGQHLGGFANGVLRTAARAVQTNTLPEPEVDEASASSSGRSAVRQIAVAYSHPNWMTSRWLKRFGNEATIRLLQHNNTPPAYGIRVNPARGMTVDKLLAALTEAGVDAERSPFLPHEFIRVHSGMQALLAQGWLSSGEIAVQDEAAGLVVALLDPSPGETLLDACAAPGGKTLFAAQRMHGSGRITAMDVSAGRLRALARAADAAGVRGMIEVVAADLREHAARLNAGADHAETGGDAAVGESMQRTAAGSAEGAGSGRRRVNLARGQQSGSQLYDKVLLDAPCSGTGVLAKRADLRWRREAEALAELTQLQDELLDAAAACVAPGGVLLYSTCSIEPEEDIDRVYAFLDRHQGEFVLERPTVLQTPEQATVLQASQQASSGNGDGVTGAGAGGSSEQDGSSGGGGDGVGRGRGVPNEVLTPGGFLLTLPHVHGIDGAFGARLRRRKA